MNWNVVEGNWKQLKGRAKMQWGRLIDDHVGVVAGKRIELAGRVQEAFGIAKDEAEERMKRFAVINKDYRP